MAENKYELVDNVIERHERNHAALIAMLQEIQEELRYLPEDVLVYLAQSIGVTTARVYGVATFFENFSLEPKGKYIIKVCDGAACHVKKSQGIIDAMRKEFDISKDKPTTNDMLFTLEMASCIGACGLAPVITINNKMYPKVIPESIVDVLRGIREEENYG